MTTCPLFWLDAPQVLLDDATEFFPFTQRDQRCTAAALNSFTRFGIYLSILLAIVRMQPFWLLVGVVFATFSVGAWFMMGARGAVREGFTEGNLGTEAPVVDPRTVEEKYVPDVIGEEGRTMPSASNPFMNVLISEISDNPYRDPAANVQGVAVKSQLDSYFQTMFANNPGDVFNRTQSQRQWYSMPSTTIPNDQESFQNWLYRTPGQTCKEGNQAACTYYETGPMDYPWRQLM
jgi:hypothetical protein